MEWVCRAKTGAIQSVHLGHCRVPPSFCSVAAAQQHTISRTVRVDCSLGLGHSHRVIRTGLFLFETCIIDQRVLGNNMNVNPITTRAITA
jgi:hypothetical protein